MYFRLLDFLEKNLNNPWQPILIQKRKLNWDFLGILQMHILTFSSPSKGRQGKILSHICTLPRNDRRGNIIFKCICDEQHTPFWHSNKALRTCHSNGLPDSNSSFLTIGEWRTTMFRENTQQFSIVYMYMYGITSDLGIKYNYYFVIFNV